MARRILVVDDHQAARATIGQLIRDSGEDWEVCCEADGGRAAVKMALECGPDLVILDIRMPDMDGMRAGREIRARLPDVPILIYSLVATPHMEDAVRRAGFQGVVAKPDGVGLVAAMRKLLQPSESCKDRPTAPEARQALASDALPEPASSQATNPGPGEPEPSAA